MLGIVMFWMGKRQVMLFTLSLETVILFGYSWDKVLVLCGNCWG